MLVGRSHTTTYGLLFGLRLQQQIDLQDYILDVNHLILIEVGCREVERTACAVLAEDIVNHRLQVYHIHRAVKVGITLVEQYANRETAAG